MVTVTATRRPPAKRAPAKRPAARKKAPPPRPRSLAGHLGHGVKVGAAALGRQGREFWGVVLLVLAGLAALGIYGDFTGPFGHAVRDGTGALVGWARLIVPIGLAATGVSLFRGRPEPPSKGPTCPARPPARRS